MIFMLFLKKPVFKGVGVQYVSCGYSWGISNCIGNVEVRESFDVFYSFKI